MNNLQTILNNLDAIAESYVWTRSKHLNASIETILNKIGVSRTKFYADYDRDELDEIARLIFRDNEFRAMRTLDEAAQEAAESVINIMRRAKSDFTRLQAAKTVLEYSLGTPVQRVDHTTQGEQLKVQVVYENNIDSLE